MLSLLTALSLAAAPAMDLVWHDEFDGGKLDAAKWNVEVNGDGGGNDELQYYTARPENVRVEGGHLVITSRREDHLGRRYTSGRLNTKGKFARRYGRFEARMQLPTGQGMWPAFWMLGADIDAKRWPACGEIDIMENVGKEPTTVHGTIHGAAYHGVKGITAAREGSLEGWHVFRADWAPKRIDFFVDGVRYASRTPADLPAGATWDFEHPFFLILNNAVGGNWPGPPDATTKLPQELRVDYVRVWSLPE